DVFTLTSIFPIWIALLSWPFFGETPTAQVWLSVISGVIGVAIIQQYDVQRTKYIAVFPLGVSIFTAFAMIGLDRPKGIHTLAVVVHFHTVALTFALATFFLFGREKPFTLQSGSALWQLIGVGLSATVGQLFLTLAFMHGDPSRVSVVGLTQIL